MGRIAIEATISTGVDSDAGITCEARVDTGAAYLTLPNAWRSRLGGVSVLDTVDVETDGQSVLTGQICGPVMLRFGDSGRSGRKRCSSTWNLPMAVTNH